MSPPRQGKKQAKPSEETKQFLSALETRLDRWRAQEGDDLHVYIEAAYDLSQGIRTGVIQ